VKFGQERNDSIAWGEKRGDFEKSSSGRGIKRKGPEKVTSWFTSTSKESGQEKVLRKKEETIFIEAYQKASQKKADPNAIAGGNIN